MDHRGLRERLTGAGCTSCGAVIPADGIAVLADRGDIAFVELSCPRCDSRTMSLVIVEGAADPVLDTAADAGIAGGPAFDEEDVRAVHRVLAGWQGDLRTLLGPPGRGTAGGRAR